MNKVFIGLILAVCILGMALVMLNDRLGRSPENSRSLPVSEVRAPSPSQVQMEADARAREIAEAATRTEHQEQEIPVQEPGRLSPGLMDEKESIERIPALPSAPVAEQPQPSVIAAEPKPAPVKPDLPKPVPPKAEPVKPEPAKQQPTVPETPKVTAETAKPEQGKPGASQNMTATKFVVYSRDKGATVRIGGDSKMEFSHMILDNPERVVVDLAGEWKFPTVPGIPKNDLVQAIRVGQNGSKTRIVIDMKEKPRKVQMVPFKDGRGVDVRVDK